MGSAFHQLCPRYSGTQTPSAPMAVTLLETFTYYKSESFFSVSGPVKVEHDYKIWFMFENFPRPLVSLYIEPLPPLPSLSNVIRKRKNIVFRSE